MKLAFSKPELFPFETNASFQDGGIKIQWGHGSPSLESEVVLTEDFIRGYIGSKEFSEATNIYILADNAGQFFALRAKMSESYLNKQSGFEYARQQKLVIIGQIYVPFNDTPFEDWVLRLNFKVDQELPSEFAGAEEIGSTLQDFHAFAYKNFPALRTLSSVPVTNGAKITVQLTKDGVDIKKPGVRIFAKTSAGYLARTESYTDENGRASFVAMPLGLEPGEKMTPEFGFKWVTNLARVDVVA